MRQGTGYCGSVTRPYRGDDVALARRQGGQPGGLGVARWGRAGALHLVEDVCDHCPFELDLPGMDLPDRLQEGLRRVLLADHAHGAATHGLPIEVRGADPGQDEPLCPRGRGA